VLNLTGRGFTRLVGWLALLIGALILLRDLLQVRSLPYTVAGIGMLAFGAWRLQSAARGR
jgi:Na+/phosphate symporter